MKKYVATLLSALWVGLFAPAAFAQRSAAPIHLEVGQSHTFRVVARNQYNASQVMLQAGATYQFHVSGSWTDKNIRTNANGWTSDAVRPIMRPLVRAAEKKRRYPNANWFALIGTIGCNECDHFYIGCGGAQKTFTVRQSGPLYAFANDLTSKYGNNSGCLTVTIQRVATHP